MEVFDAIKDGFIEVQLIDERPWWPALIPRRQGGTQLGSMTALLPSAAKLIKSTSARSSQRTSAKRQIYLWQKSFRYSGVRRVRVRPGSVGWTARTASSPCSASASARAEHANADPRKSFRRYAMAACAAASKAATRSPICSNSSDTAANSDPSPASNAAANRAATRTRGPSTMAASSRRRWAHERSPSCGSRT